MQPSVISKPEAVIKVLFTGTGIVCPFLIAIVNLSGEVNSSTKCHLSVYFSRALYVLSLIKYSRNHLQCTVRDTTVYATLHVYKRIAFSNHINTNTQYSRHWQLWSEENKKTQSETKLVAFKLSMFSDSQLAYELNHY